MAKATSKKDDAVVEPAINTAEAPKSMSKAQAEAIVKKYSGINGMRIPELEKAKQVLKGK